MKGATFTALWFSARPRQKTCNQTHLQTHHPQNTTNNQTLFKNITHNETLETFWLQQDEDSQEFIRSLQQMDNKINKICVNQMVQTNIRKFFNRS